MESMARRLWWTEAKMWVLVEFSHNSSHVIDPYDITSGTPPQQPEQSLNEEVSQVMGQLGRFWGDFRKQARPFEPSHLLN